MSKPPLHSFPRKMLTSEGIKAFCQGFNEGLELPAHYTISEWADNFRVLSSESSAEPGPWNTSRAEYQRGIMDAISDINVSEVTIVASAQVGKTEIINNVVGYYIDNDPCPILLLQPTKEVAESWSNDRLKPMLRDTPCLRGKIQEGKDNGNTVLHKSFPGGHITMVGANSPSGLASRPIRVVLLDEVDRYPLSAGKEGDPVKLAIKRTTTFWNRKIVKCSTPTIKGLSKIDNSFRKSDQRYFFVPCPHCGVMQKIMWSNVVWDKNEAGEGLPDTAAYCCPHCGSLWNDVERWAAIAKGEWRASKPFRGHAGFSLWEGYSPWVKLSEIVTSFLDAKKDGPEALQTFINTSLGECWEDKGESVDDSVLYERREDYSEAPAGVVVVTGGVDVQANRLELELVGWGVDGQSWGLGKYVILGDPTIPDPWNELDNILKRPVPHEIAGEMRVKACCVDSGYLTQKVGEFCKERWGRHIWAVKGMPGQGRPIMKQAPGKLKKLNLSFFMVGADTAKDVIYTRLKIDKPDAPGYCHFNMSYDSNHFEQLTAEEVKTEYKSGRKLRYWKLKDGHKRNEALDIRVYAMAALEGLLLSGFSLRQQHQKIWAKYKHSAAVEQAIKDNPAVSEDNLPPPPPILKKRKKRRIVATFG